MKKILIIGAGAEQAIAIRLAKRMGIKVIAVDGNPKAVGLKIADVGIPVDIKDIAKLIQIGKKYKVNGVFCHAVEIPVVVAKVTKALGLPGLSPVVAERATNKLKRIKCLTAKGVPCPRFEVARSVKEAEEKAKKIGFPLVIKPVDNAGARGVRRINSYGEIKDAVLGLKKFTKNNVFLLEQLLEGKEISTESLIFNGKIYHTGFGDRNYERKKEFAPYFVEDGHNVPSRISAKEKQKVFDACEKAILAIGINWGVAKGDIMISNGKAYVFEMAARSSGGWFAAGTVPIATGVNIIKPLIKMSLGEPLDLKDIKPRFNKAACQRYIIPTETGYFEKFEGLAEAKKMPGVKMFVLFKTPKKGDLITKSTNHAERFGQLITQGDNIPDAIEKCENAMKKIKIILSKEKLGGN